MVGTDAGIYESFDLAQNWHYFLNLPLTQFYKVAVNNAEPFYHIFGGTQDWDQGDHLQNAADRAGLLLSELEAAIEGGDQLTEVAENQRALAAVGHWGVPTMVVREEPFFGQDRIKTLCWRLDQYGLARSG